MIPIFAKSRAYTSKPGKKHERMVVGYPISATDEPLDNLLYELYGLTDKG